MSLLNKIKYNLQQDNASSEAWYLRQKVEQFERCLQAIEANFSQASKQILILEKFLAANLKKPN